MSTLEKDILKGEARRLYELLEENGYVISNCMCGMNVDWEDKDSIDNIIKLINDNGFVNVKVEGRINYVKMEKIDSFDKHIKICFIN